MASLSSRVRGYLEKADGLRILELVARLSRLHRIQSTQEIVEACKLVSSLLSEYGVEYRLHVHTGPLNLHTRYGFGEARGWRIHRLEVYRYSGGKRELVASARRHPLYAFAHTPSGVVEATARLVGDPSQASSEFIPIIIPGRGRGYWEAVEAGAPAVIATHRGPGIRYYSVFPPVYMEPPKAPAASLEYSAAVRLHGEKVRIEAEAGYGDPVTPILYARAGRGEPRVLVVAHICHPRPGAHDNASGVAVAVELLRLLRDSRDAGVDVLLVPEYTGTAAAFSLGIVDPRSYVAAVSLDMVGADLRDTGGSLQVVSSLYSLPSPLDPLLYRALYKALSDAGAFMGSARYPTTSVVMTPYSGGSDHDIALAYGIPSSLVNEWPDRYYHTSLDTPDRLSPERLAAVAAAVAAAVEHLSTALSEPEQHMEEVAKVVGYHAQLTLPEERLEHAKKLLEVGVQETLSRVLELQGKTPWAGGWSRDVEPRIRGPLSRLWLRKLRPHQASKLLVPGREDAYTHLAPITLSATYSTRAVELELKTHYGVELGDSLEALLEAMEALRR